MNFSLPERIAYSIFLLIVALAMPYWAFFIFACVGFAIFSWYAEAIVIAAMLDMMVGAPLVQFHGLVAFGLVFVALLCLVIEGIKKLVRYGI